MALPARARIASVFAICLVMLGAPGALAGSVTGLEVGDIHELGWVLYGVPHADSDNLAYVNQLVGMGLSTTGSALGQQFTRSANNFGPLPNAALDDRVSGTGTLLDIGTDGAYAYLIAKYDGPNDGSEVWYVGNLSGLVSIPAFHDANGLFGWTLFQPIVRRPDAQIRRGSSSSYEGDDVYLPIIQGVSNTGVVGQKVTFFILVENDGNDLDSFRVKRAGSFHAGYRVRYVDASGTDVTGQVNTGTFTTPGLSPGDEYVMRATVRIRPQATPCSFVQRTITVTSSNDSKAKDEVRFIGGLNVC